MENISDEKDTVRKDYRFHEKLISDIFAFETNFCHQNLVNSKV